MTDNPFVTVMLYISQPDSKETIVNNVLAIVFIHELPFCQ